MKFALYAPLSRIVSYVLLYALTLVVVLPVVWLAYSIFKTSTDIFQSPFSLPTSFDLSNLREAWQLAHFDVLYVNSLEITLTSVAGILLLEGLAAYAFARLRFPGKEILFVVFLVGQMVPAQMVLLPSFVEISALGLTDTKLSLILQYMSWAPFAILFLRASFLAVPVEIEEAALIDGAGRLTILWKIMLPMTSSAFATIATIYSLWIWNDFLFPLAYIRSAANFTVPLGLGFFQEGYTTYWGDLVAAIGIAIWPPMLLYIALSRPIQASLASGAVKL
jgi:ABC-type glycerol-3-phosphate transport system permease component